MRSPPCKRPAGRLFFRRCQRRAAERHAGSTRRVGSSTADRALRSCGKHPGSYAPHKARSSPPPPKQLDSHPVIQSDCPAAPFAISAYVCFVAARRPGERSVTSFGNTQLVWRVRKSEVKQKQRLQPPEAFTPLVFVFVLWSLSCYYWFALV